MAFFVRRGARGFTLKEILIVGAIIALLATTVLVGAQNARKVARDKQRVSDLQQVQLAVRMYRDAHPDADTDLAPYATNGAWIGNGNAFDTLLAPYVSGIHDPIDTGSYQYFYDDAYTCAGTVRSVLIALAMENSSAGNFASVCGAGPYENIRSGKTPTASSYIIIVK